MTHIRGDRKHNHWDSGEQQAIQNEDVKRRMRLIKNALMPSMEYIRGPKNEPLFWKDGPEKAFDPFVVTVHRALSTAEKVSKKNLSLSVAEREDTQN